MNKKTIATLLGIMSIVYSYGQSLDSIYSANIYSAAKYYNNKEFELSLSEFEKAFLIKNNKPIDLYNGACSAALSKKINRAFTLLNQALNSGYHNADHLQKDSDLYDVHPFPEWRNIVSIVKQNEKDYKSNSETIKFITHSVEKNQTEVLWKLCSEEYKSVHTKKDLIETVDNIRHLFKIYDVSFFDFKFSSSSNSNHSLNKSGEIKNKELVERTYYYTPPFFGLSYNSILVSSIGYEIGIKIIRTNIAWEIRKISIESNYHNSDFQINNYIEEFLSYGGQYSEKYSVIKEQKRLYGFEETKIKTLVPLLKSLNPQYIKTDTIGVQRFSKNLVSLSLYKKVPNLDTLDISEYSFFTSPSDSTIVFLELVIPNDEKNIALISNGEKYAFYEIENILRLKEFVLSKFDRTKKWISTN